MGVVDPSVSAANYAAAVTTSDATVFDPPTRGLYVGGAGDVTVRMAIGQNVVTFAGVLAGTLLPIAVDQVRAATTATAMTRVW